MENIGRSIKKAAQKMRSGTCAPDFWAFVRSLENANSAKPRLGKAKTPSDENVRFGQAPYLHFPSTDIAEIIEGGRFSQANATIILYFFGLLGVNGPMPLEFTNYVFRRSHNYFDNTWRRFLDIIHHRFTSLYYRSFSANQQAINYDRKEDDMMSKIIKSLAGFSPKGNLSARNESLVLKSAQQFSFLTKNRQNLENMLRRLFEFDLEVKEFIHSTRDIPKENKNLLGRRNTTLGYNLQIGNTFIGATGMFEIHLSPLSFEEYRSFMSSKNGAQLLIEAVSLYLDRPVKYTLVFPIVMRTIPVAQLGFDLAKGRWDAPQLGFTCWIGDSQEELMTLRISADRFIRKNKL